MNLQAVEFLRALSRLLGWLYMLAWSLSFYPQPLMNWKRRSAEGLAPDFPFLNIVGFTCYTVSLAALLYSPVIREEYAVRHPSAPVPTVRVNDFVYSVHALVMVALVYSQFFPTIWGFRVSKDQRVRMSVLLLTAGCLVGVCIVAILVATSHPSSITSVNDWAWIDLIFTIGYVKLIVTFVKYVPQAWLNYQRKSTAGWSIDQILLDVAGSILSTLQLLIDASLQNSWRDIIDNPVKLGLGYVSMFFDLIFITQHYVLYAKHRVQQKRSEQSTPEQEALLGAES